MSNTSKELSAADLIKRFREGKPMSADERRSAMGDRAKMWWEDTSQNMGAAGSGLGGGTFEDSPVPRGRSQLISPESSIRGGRSRSPIGAGRRSSSGIRGGFDRDRDLDVTADDDLDFLRQSHRSLGESRENALRQSRMSVRDEVDDPMFRSRTFGRSLDVDALIGNELQRLKEDVRKKEQATLRRLNSGSYGPLMSSKAGSIDLGKSTETLGSTGFLGLLKSELRLGGDGDKKKAKEEENPADVPQPESTSPEELNKSLEALLADLKKNIPPEPPKNTYLPEGIEETIPQITDKLTQEMKQLTAIFDYATQEVEKAEKEKAQKEYEEKLRQEGREEERKKLFLEAIDTPDPQDLLTVWKSASSPNVVPPRMRGTGISSRGASVERDPLGDSVEDAAGLARIRRKRHESALVMQKAIDNEMSSAEEIFHKMRHLRTNLGLKMHQVNALGDVPAAMGVGGRGIAIGDRGAVVEPVGSKYWGLEEYKEELEIREFDGDIRKTFNPYPNLVHENIFKVTQAVESTLNVAMDILKKRLGHEESPTPAPSAPSDPPVVVKPAPPAEDLVSSFEFELSTSLPASPFRDVAKQFVGDLSAVAPQPKTVDMKTELATIDKILGPEENITYANTSARPPQPKPLAAGRFDRFLMSKQKGEALFRDHDDSPPISPTITIDPLRDVRHERKIFVGPPAIFNEEKNGGMSIPSAPPAPLSKPPMLFDPAQHFISNPLPFTSALTPPSSSSRMKLNMHTAEELSFSHRPMEGTAMSYLKSQQQSSPSISPHYNPPSMEKAMNQKIPSAITTPSSASSVLEREEFLQRMKNLRQKIQTKH